MQTVEIPLEEKTSFETGLSKEIYTQTYKFGEDKNINYTLYRVAKDLASVEDDPEYWAEKFYNLMSEFKFVPGGRIISNAGTNLNGTSYINCFVSGARGYDIDSMSSIMDELKRQALILKSEGGYGFCSDFMRPRGGVIKGIGAMSPGAVRMLDMWDTQSATITRGADIDSDRKDVKKKIRKGAQMVTMSIWHPDIEEFIKAKQTEGRLTKFNMSVLVSDRFMEAVKNNDSWSLEFPDHEKHPEDYKKYWDGNINKWKALGYDTKVYKTYNDANELWNTIMQSTYNRNEPGVLFVDRINDLNNLYYEEYISATNPCFTGDTKVWTSKGWYTFSSLADEGKDIEVLTQLDDGTLVYRTMKNPRMTQKNQSLVRVHLDNDTYINCTPNHEFYLREGGSKEAKNLTEGDSLASVYRYNANQKGYKRLTNGIHKPLEHHVPYEEDLGGYHIHHINGIKDDNNPENLEKIAASEHNAIHMRGNNNPSITHPENNWLIKQDHSGKNNGRYRDDINDDYIKSLRREGLTYKAIAKKLNCSSYTVAKRLGYERPVNHKVISVEELDYKEDVYCGTVEGTHKFFVGSGKDDAVLVHNCGEQLLSVDDVCLLGSFNITQFLLPDYSGWDFDKLEEYIPTAVRMLDNVNDRTYVPLEGQRENLKNKRRIGLGIMGLGSALMMQKVRYGSPEAVKRVEELEKFIANKAYQASSNLAKEKSPFPLFDKDKYMESNFIKRLDEETQNMIAEQGIRNSHLLSIQPTGNTSILANGVSGGLEPVFMHEYIRTSQQPFAPEGLAVPDNINWKSKSYTMPDSEYYTEWKWSKEGDTDLLRTTFNNKVWKIDEARGLLKEELIEDYAVRHLKEKNEWDSTADWAATTTELAVKEHTSIMSTLAYYIDSAMSKTVNLPNDYPYEDFKDLYIDMYESGSIKGGTTYRAGTMTTVLSSKEENNTEGIKKADATKRPKELPCDIHKLRAGGGTWRVIVGLLNDEPYEIFAFKTHNTHLTETEGILEKKGKGKYNLKTVEGEIIVEDIGSKFETDEQEALTRMISSSLRHGMDVMFIVEQLSKSPGMVTSFNKAISRILSKYVSSFREKELQDFDCSCTTKEEQKIVREEGCIKCLQCGDSKCT